MTEKERKNTQSINDFKKQKNIKGSKFFISKDF